MTDRSIPKKLLDLATSLFPKEPTITTTPVYTSNFGKIESYCHLISGKIDTINFPETVELYEKTVTYMNSTETRQPFKTNGRWIIHVFQGVTSSGSFVYPKFVDNYGNIYLRENRTDDNQSWCIEPDWRHVSHKKSVVNTVPLSDNLITQIKNIGSFPLFADDILDILLYYHAILMDMLAPYQIYARREYLYFFQNKLPVIPNTSTIDKLASELEEEKAKTKILEARISVLEALISAHPCPNVIELET